MPKTLVIYYSHSGTTRRLAKEIAKQVNADLHELLPEKAYSFSENTAAKELRNEIERGFCPKLLNNEINPEKYDNIFIGSPNWFKTFAPPILTFLRHTNLKNKTIIPFCTSGGGGFGKMIQDINGECPSSTILTGLEATSNYTENEVTNWLKSIKLIYPPL